MRTAPPAASHGRSPAPHRPAEPALLDLSVVIVNYNVREFLEQALRSVERAAVGLGVEVFVVDNNSVDGSVEMVQEQFPDVHLIANADNVGFSTANNQAIRRAQGRHLLILNPDTIVGEDTFTALLRFMETHPEAGAVGCQILNPDGTFAPESRRAFPTPAVAFYRMTGLGRLFPRSPRFGRYNLTYLPRDAVAEVDALSGSCMLVRRAALYESRPGAARADGAGLFDEDFFMYGEDLDWCYRIQQAGWKIYYTPETQIIHYKGESTKKGELRYVRLFYGAMLRFTEKHLHNRHTRLFALLLRAAIVVRAGLTLVGNVVRGLAGPGLDAALTYAVVTLLYLVRSGIDDLSGLFFVSVALAYALGTALGVALAGGYRRTRRARLRPVFAGATLGLLVVAALSFFVKDVAYSRAVVLLAYPLLLVVLGGWRVVAARRGKPRLAILVGSAGEARRLAGMLATHPRPPFRLVGYVDAHPGTDPAADRPDVPPRLGTLHHLRDLARLRRIDDVVFAADGLSHRTTFGLMRRLRDLPVQFRMLAEGREHLIGKAAIEDLALPQLVPAEEALGTQRSPAARRAFEIGAALLGLALHPAAVVLGRLLGPRSYPARLTTRTRLLPDVLAGRRALVGYDPDTPYRPPAEWGLEPGVFDAADAALDAAARDRAYGLYARHASAALDAAIVGRALTNLPH